MTDKRQTLTLGGGNSEKKTQTNGVVIRRRRVFRPNGLNISTKNANTAHLKNLLSKAKKESSEKEKAKEEAKTLDEKRRALMQEDIAKKEKIKEKLSENLTEAVVETKKTEQTKTAKAFGNDKQKDKKFEEKKRGEKKSFGNNKRRKLTVQDISLNETDGIKRSGNRKSISALRRKLEKEKEKQKEDRENLKTGPREIIIPETITVKDLSTRLSEKSGAVVKKLMEMGTMATVNQVIDADTAELIVI